MNFEVDFPLTYYFSLIIFLIALLISAANIKRSWVPGYVAVLLTVFVWYFIEPLYFPEEFAGFDEEVIALGYGSVLIFLLSFIIFSPTAIRIFYPKKKNNHFPANAVQNYNLNIEKIIRFVFFVWLLVFVYGLFRVDFNIFGALFPIEGRSGEAAAMFARAGGANAGPTGFVVSTAGYLYQLCLAAFGLFLPLARKPSVRWFLLGMIALTWPGVFLSGTRNAALAVSVPLFISFLLYFRAGFAIKAIFLLVSFITIEFILRAMIAFRDSGFMMFEVDRLENTKHFGLNMASELMHVTAFIKYGIMDLSYGARYLADIANIIPRAIWSEKPMIGIDYAVARGFGGASGDIGVFATVSTGMIGQGVINFGNYIGPVIVAVLMSSWVGILNRLRVQGDLPRIGLFLVGLGITFNLGREVTLLVLFPFLFGYVGVKIFDRIGRRRGRRTNGHLQSGMTSVK